MRSALSNVRCAHKPLNPDPMLDKNGIARRIAQEVQNGWYVNLGIGIPTLVAKHMPEG